MRGEFPELVALLRAEQSFDNALEVQRVKGWAVVKGFAVYDLYDCPEGDAYVGYRHWWNANDDGTWCVRLPSPSSPPPPKHQRERGSGPMAEGQAGGGRERVKCCPYSTTLSLSL
jgi:hypothetical protein